MVYPPKGPFIEPSRPHFGTTAKVGLWRMQRCARRLLPFFYFGSILSTNTRRAAQSVVGRRESWFNAQTISATAPVPVCSHAPTISLGAPATPVAVDLLPHVQRRSVRLPRRLGSPIRTTVLTSAQMDGRISRAYTATNGRAGQFAIAATGRRQKVHSVVRWNVV
jgi:hypothetical protein